MAKLLDLAKKNIKKSDDEKALDALKEQVEDNKMAFELDLHKAKKTAKTAASRVEALAADPTATAATIIEATREAAVAAKNVEDITAIIASRF